MAGPAAAAAKLTSQTYTAPDRLFGNLEDLRPIAPVSDGE